MGRSSTSTRFRPHPAFREEMLARNGFPRSSISFLASSRAYSAVRCNAGCLLFSLLICVCRSQSDTSLECAKARSSGSSGIRLIFSLARSDCRPARRRTTREGKSRSRRNCAPYLRSNTRSGNPSAKLFVFVSTAGVTLLESMDSGRHGTARA
jgi:hypothetical protein